MKLILFLLAIYSLIFYQRYKIDRPRTTVTVLQNNVSRNKGFYPYHVLASQAETTNVKSAIRIYYPASRQYNIRQPQMVNLSFINNVSR